MTSATSPSTLSLPHRPEGELILGCICPGQPQASKQRILEALDSSPDWRYVLEASEKHRVTPLVYRSLRALGFPQTPEMIQKELRRRFYRNAQNNLQLTQELVALDRQFKHRQIPMLPYKGVILSSMVYGAISLRQVWDLDILVHPQTVEKTQALLTLEGFELVQEFDREQTYRHSARPVEVDLHWGLTPAFFPVDISFDTFWQERQPVEVNNSQLSSFSKTDLLLILCLQIAKDCWERQQRIEHLAKVCDLAALIETSPELDWQSIVGRSQQMGTYKITAFAINLARVLFNLKLSQQARSAFPRNKAIDRLIATVCRDLFSDRDRHRSDPDTSYLDFSTRTRQLSFYWQLRERPRDKVQHTWEILKTLTTGL